MIFFCRRDDFSENFYDLPLISEAFFSAAHHNTDLDHAADHYSRAACWADFRSCRDFRKAAPDSRADGCGDFRSCRDFRKAAPDLWAVGWADFLNCRELHKAAPDDRAACSAGYCNSPEISLPVEYISFLYSDCPNYFCLTYLSLLSKLDLSEQVLSSFLTLPKKV